MYKDETLKYIAALHQIKQMAYADGKSLSPLWLTSDVTPDTGWDKAIEAVNRAAFALNPSIEKEAEKDETLHDAFVLMNKMILNSYYAGVEEVKDNE